MKIIIEDLKRNVIGTYNEVLHIGHIILLEDIAYQVTGVVHRVKKCGEVLYKDKETICIVDEYVKPKK